jgi:hypothetical protein
MQMDAIEERLAKLLRDKWTACQDAEGIFQIFARFNPLLIQSPLCGGISGSSTSSLPPVGHDSASHQPTSKLSISEPTNKSSQLVKPAVQSRQQ